MDSAYHRHTPFPRVFLHGCQLGCVLRQVCVDKANPSRPQGVEGMHPAVESLAEHFTAALLGLLLRQSEKGKELSSRSSRCARKCGSPSQPAHSPRLHLRPRFTKPARQMWELRRSGASPWPSYPHFRSIHSPAHSPNATHTPVEVETCGTTANSLGVYAGVISTASR